MEYASLNRLFLDLILYYRYYDFIEPRISVSLKDVLNQAFDMFDIGIELKF